MSYNIYIEYTSNKNKAGKLSLFNNDGKTILNKVPVTIPEFKLLENIINENLHKFISISNNSINFSEINAHFLKNEFKVEKSINKFDMIFNENNICVMASQTKKELLVPDDDAFILKKEHLNVISQLINKGNNIKIKAKKVNFLWFPENISSATTNLNEIYLSYKDYCMVSVQKKEEIIPRNKEIKTLNPINNKIKNSKQVNYLAVNDEASRLLI